MTEEAVVAAVREYNAIYNTCASDTDNCDGDEARTRMTEAVVENLAYFMQTIEEGSIVPDFQLEIASVTINNSTESSLVEICDFVELPTGARYYMKRTGLELTRIDDRWYVSGILTTDTLPRSNQCATE